METSGHSHSNANHINNRGRIRKPEGLRGHSSLGIVMFTVSRIMARINM